MNLEKSITRVVLTGFGCFVFAAPLLAQEPKKEEVKSSVVGTIEEAKKAAEPIAKPTISPTANPVVSPTANPTVQPTETPVKKDPVPTTIEEAQKILDGTADTDIPPPPKVSKKDKKDKKDKNAKKGKKGDESAPEVVDQTVADGELSDAEKKALLPVYDDVLENYFLGPQDVISVEVFGECPNYCKENIIIPPTGKISYPLIRDGVFVRGKTPEQVAEDITKKLDEFIINPSVTVSIIQANSARYMIVGDVAQQGLKIMSRRISIFEALTEAGLLATADKRRVSILRLGVDHKLSAQTINFQDIMMGKSEMVYLQPGDQVVVPGSKIARLKKGLLDAIPLLGFARIFFTGGL